MARKQLEVPGTERETIPELEDVGQAYVKVLYKRMELGKKELELKAQLHERMRQLDQLVYVLYDKDDNGFKVSRKPGEEKLAVERLDKPKESSGEAEG